MTGIGPIELIIVVVIMFLGGLLPLGSLVLTVLVYLKVKKIEEILEKQS
jgi:hypothetical protein